MLFFVMNRQLNMCGHFSQRKLGLVWFMKIVSPVFSIVQQNVNKCVFYFTVVIRMHCFY